MLLVMRLTQEQIKVIRREAGSVFGPDVTVRLFGSRVDDQARGGDIDLLVSSSLPLEEPVLKAARLEARLLRQLGDRRIDVLLEAPNLLHESIHEVAHREGVKL